MLLITILNCRTIWEARPSWRFAHCSVYVLPPWPKSTSKRTSPIVSNCTFWLIYRVYSEFDKYVYFNIKLQLTIYIRCYFLLFMLLWDYDMVTTGIVDNRLTILFFRRFVGRWMDILRAPWQRVWQVCTQLWSFLQWCRSWQGYTDISGRPVLRVVQEIHSV